MGTKTVTYACIEVGQSEEQSIKVTQDIINQFSDVSGDINPIHHDEDYAATTSFGRCIAHGIFTVARISALLGTRLPGVGTIYLSQDIKFKAPVFIGDELVARITVTEKIDKGSRVKFHCVCLVDEKIVAEGEAMVIAPTTE